MMIWAGTGEMCATFLSKNLQNKDHFGYISVGGKANYDGVKRINLAQHKDQWQSLVNTVMNIRILQETGNFVNR
jgi:hypothetical protein